MRRAIALAVGSLGGAAAIRVGIWAYLALPPATVIVWVLIILAVVFFAALAFFLTADRTDPFAAGAHDTDPDAYLEPLRRPGAHEENLDTDLRYRRMFLRPYGLTHRHAKALAAKVAARAHRRRARAAMEESLRARTLGERLATTGEMRAVGLRSAAATEPGTAVSVPAEPQTIHEDPAVTPMVPAMPAPVPDEENPETAYASQPPFEQWLSDTFVGGIPAVKI